MQAVLKILEGAVPSVITVAENLFHPGAAITIPSGQSLGDLKKKFAMDLLSAAWDNTGAKLFPTIQGLDEKKLFMDICSTLIEALVPVLTK